jgi:hypothetical protein
MGFGFSSGFWSNSSKDSKFVFEASSGPHYLVFQHRNAASQRGGGEGLRLQSQGGQDLCAAAAAEHLIFKTSPEEQTVDLTNKGMPKDSQRFSRWFHSGWRTTGAVGL